MHTHLGILASLPQDKLQEMQLQGQMGHTFLKVCDIHCQVALRKAVPIYILIPSAVWESKSQNLHQE